MDGSIETMGKEVVPLPVLIYGRPTCEGTALVRKHLQSLEIPFVEVDIEEDEKASRFVERVNHGNRLTPTIVFGQEAFIIVEPSISELNQALRRAGYGV